MIVEIKDLHFKYPSGEKALNGININLEDEQPVAIIGQNGSGKTTLVKQFNGLLKPVSGDVLINGKSIIKDNTADISKTVGYVFQNPDDQLFLDSVKKELEYGPNNIGMSEEKKKECILYATKLCGLEDKLDKHPFDLSQAEKKFCTIASVIAMDPKIIIFDEPTMGQDKKGLETLHNIIESLTEKGKLCITISHDMKFVVENFKRIIVLCKGKVLLDGDRFEVFNKPEVLKESFVTPPPITRIAQKSGIGDGIYNIEQLVEKIKEIK